MARDITLAVVSAILAGIPGGAFMGLLMVPALGVEPGPASNAIVYVCMAMGMAWAAMIGGTYRHWPR